MNDSYLEKFGNHYTRTYSFEVDGKSRQLTLEYRYLVIIDKWVISIFDSPTGELLVANIPLVYNKGDNANLLQQLNYLGIGSCAITKLVDEPLIDKPTGNNFGSEYALAWGNSSE